MNDGVLSRVHISSTISFNWQTIREDNHLLEEVSSIETRYKVVLCIYTLLELWNNVIFSFNFSLSQEIKSYPVERVIY